MNVRTIQIIKERGKSNLSFNFTLDINASKSSELLEKWILLTLIDFLLENFTSLVALCLEPGGSKRSLHLAFLGNTPC